MVVGLCVAGLRLLGCRVTGLWVAGRLVALRAQGKFPYVQCHSHLQLTAMTSKLHILEEKKPIS